jgi:hypothetical protein
MTAVTVRLNDNLGDVVWRVGITLHGATSLPFRWASHVSGIPLTIRHHPANPDLGPGAVCMKQRFPSDNAWKGHLKQSVNQLKVISLQLVNAITPDFGTV